MKKLITSVALLIITLTGCSSDDKETQTGGLSNAKQMVNRYKIAVDITDDGIENFGVEGQEYSGLYVFEYRGSEKKVTIGVPLNEGTKILETYTVTSEKDGNMTANNGTTTCVFKFTTTEVYQTLKLTAGEKRYRYYFK